MIFLRPLATILLIFAAPLLGQGQSIEGLTARSTANAIVLSPAFLEGAALEDLQFSYSQDSGATWKPINTSCLEFVSGEAIWHVLECLQVDVFEGSNIRFKASLSSCSPVAFDGYTYKVVQIGSQCWFAENLRSTHYANSDAIPGNLTAQEWKTTSSGAQAVFNNTTANLTKYGRLYNWYAVDDARGLCPSSWHVPTDGEYTTLEMELGMSSSAAKTLGSRGTDQGEQMKTSASESPGWDGTNSSGFSALPGGYRDYNGYFSSVGYSADFWSSSPSGSPAWNRILFSGYDDVYRDNFNRRYGFSVRCVRD